MCTPTTIMYSDCVRLKLTVSPCTFIFYHHAFYLYVYGMANIYNKKCVHIITYGQREHFFYFIFFFVVVVLPSRLLSRAQHCYKTFKYTFGLQDWSRRCGMEFLEDRGNDVGRENKKCVWPQIALPSLFLCEIWLGLLIGSFRFRLTFEIKIKYIWHCN